MRASKGFMLLIVLCLCVCIAGNLLSCTDNYFSTCANYGTNPENEKKYIKWVDFKVPYYLLEKTLNIDIKSQQDEVKLSWIDLLSYLAARYGGNFSRYKSKDLDKLITRLIDGESLSEITADMKYFPYYREAFTAILGEFVGPYEIQTKDEQGNIIWVKKYGLKVFSPIARGYYFSHYKDFGDSRSYGYKRVHFGNDLMGSIGTPVIAVEAGIVEAMGWNMYGGWRIGIRSFDKKRYYYYAHLRRGRPFSNTLELGKPVRAGDVIGYMGMTGYSTKENVNNIKVPHLHFGLQLIFDEVQKEGPNQIWVDVYNIVELLQKNKSHVVRDPETKESSRMYQIKDPRVEKYFK